MLYLCEILSQFGRSPLYEMGDGNANEALAFLSIARDARNELYNGRGELWTGSLLDMVFERFEPIAMGG